ncbi:hypothetical protein N1031_07300 [Herbiconiux moechotypicola]|uniref:Gram-positive cocci surface proteins LPxTG domain-containing protein n=1 Tax=Herbiconiux moechotypicola TaxID=637393 RepID=A0ABN3DGW1_9MICO|nr:hypothetical protein [Herbiconiux moechotypicola]MCS5729563.1 hypothetical protein [Herbiconiux moechotypicola]
MIGAIAVIAGTMLAGGLPASAAPGDEGESDSAPFVNTVPPVISPEDPVWGMPGADTLTATPGTWNQKYDSISYRWFVTDQDGNPSTQYPDYVSTDNPWKTGNSSGKYAGQFFVVQVHVFLNDGTYGTAVSDPVYFAPQGLQSGKVSIDGDGVVGSKLKAKFDDWEVPPNGEAYDYEFSWAANGVPIPEATFDTWKVTSEYAGQNITVTMVLQAEGYYVTPVVSDGLQIADVQNVVAGETVDATELPEGGVEFVLADPGAPAWLDFGAPDESGAVTVSAPVFITTPVAAVSIPAGTTISSSDPAWQGLVALPGVVDDVDVPVEAGSRADVALAVELGDPDATLTFSRTVRLLLVGQAGQLAGFVPGGGDSSAFSEIALACDADSREAADQQFDGAALACSIDVDSDLVIQTRHFTTFVAYTVTAAASTPTPTPTPTSTTAASTLAATGSPIAPLLIAVVLLGTLGLASVAVARRAVRKG